MLGMMEGKKADENAQKLTKKRKVQSLGGGGGWRGV